MSIAKRAVKESKGLAELAVSAAQSRIIEQLAPEIKAVVDAAMRSGKLDEDVDRLRRAADGHGETEFEEGKDMADDKLESVAALFPNVNEMADEVDESEDVALEGADEVDESADNDADDVAEELEMNNEELEAMYNEALQLEVDVSKGFKDMAKPHEFGAGAKGQYQSDGANLADYKNGESEWDDVDPPAKQDWTVKEAKIRRLVRKGIAENKALAEQNAKLREMSGRLAKKLKEMNLLNTKILHVNRFMTSYKLNNEQKKSVIESIDKGKTVAEVKNIYAVVEKTLRTSGAVSESADRRRAARADSQKHRTTGAADQRVLRESVDRAEGQGFGRWTQLAGLKKLTNG